MLASHGETGSCGDAVPYGVAWQTVRQPNMVKQPQMVRRLHTERQSHDVRKIHTVMYVNVAWRHLDIRLVSAFQWHGTCIVKAQRQTHSAFYPNQYKADNNS